MGLHFHYKLKQNWTWYSSKKRNKS